MPDKRQTKTASPAPHPRRLAYLVSTYPTLSMIFVLREVLGLRALGFQIETASINPPDRSTEAMTADEAAEAAHTYCVKRHSVRGALVAHLKTLYHHSKGYGCGMELVGRLAGLDLRQWFYHAMYFTEALMVGRWMQKKDLTHLHVHLASQAATVGLYVKTIFGFGYSITVHGPDEFYDAERQLLGRKAAAADFLCCISSFARSQMMKHSAYMYWHKMVVTPLGVDVEQFTPRPEREAPDVFEILCVGRLVATKGQHMLIDAVGQLVAEGRKVRLRLVGSGPDDETLHVHTSRLDHPECIIFEGPVNQDRIRSFYAQADAFAIASFAEGLPVVLMEAMAMEIPCVTTHINGIPEMIRDGQDGLLVPPSDRESLTHALRRLMDDPKLRQRLAKNGRKRIVERYNLPRNLERLAAVFSELVQ
ncbi:glycosyltransferase family 4 protein [Telmatobacter bradus]|uniref:glycosyltransferase family 4 protein n=1 Tax=Telmatobacter bradus TaxID=474953 RepID=UPI003B4293BE